MIYRCVHICSQQQLHIRNDSYQSVTHVCRSVSVCLENLFCIVNVDSFNARFALVLCAVISDQLCDQMPIVYPYPCKGQRALWRTSEEESAALWSTLKDILPCVDITECLVYSCEPSLACEQKCISPDLKKKTSYVLTRRQSLRTKCSCHCAASTRTFPRETGRAGLQELVGGRQRVKDCSLCLGFLLLFYHSERKNSGNANRTDKTAAGKTRQIISLTL